MKIKEVLEQKKPTISFEVFPPKRNMDIEGIFKTIEALKTPRPRLYISDIWRRGNIKRHDN